MKKGKWNYTENIRFKCIVARLLPVANPMHWQYRLAGQERQIVEIEYCPDGIKPYKFWIDNGDGSGLRKIERLGGPDSYSAHVAEFEFISDLPESEWKQWDPELHNLQNAEMEAWQKENHPEEYGRLLKLREGLQKLRSDNPKAFPHSGQQ